MATQAQLAALAKGRAKLAAMRRGGELVRTKPLSKKTVLHRRTTTHKQPKHISKIKQNVRRRPSLVPTTAGRRNHLGLLRLLGHNPRDTLKEMHGSGVRYL